MDTIKNQILQNLNSGKRLEDLYVTLEMFIVENRKSDESLGSFERFQHYYRDVNKKYRNFKISKKSGGDRLISAPDPYLLFIQRNLASIIALTFIPSHESHGFIENRSIVSNAELHTNKNYVLNVDLANFFPSITFNRVKNSLEAPPFTYSPEMARMIARFSVKAGKLPQGSPCSPILSNVVTQDLDKKMNEFATKYKQTYTRYADDITFSGYRRIYNESFFKELNSIIKSENFSLKKSKTRIQSRNKRQEVTGIVVNDKVNVNRKYVRELRVMIHYFHQGKGPDNAYAVISGKLEFLKMVKGKDRVYRNLLNQFKGIKNG